MCYKVKISDLPNLSFGRWKYRQLLKGNDSDFFKRTNIKIKDNYAKYSIRDKILRAKVPFLCNNSIDLAQDESKVFSIGRIWNDRHSEVNSRLLLPVNLGKYFKMKDDSKSYSAFVTEFVKNEEILVKYLMRNMNENSSFYLPIPEIEFQELIGIVYLVYDKSRLENTEDGEMLDAYEAIIAQINA